MAARLDPQTRLAWTWWKLPCPALRDKDLKDVLERNPPDTIWRSQDDLEKLIAQMAPLHRARYEAARADPEWSAGAVYRRIRVENGVRVQRAEIRYDGLAGCLRAPGGGSSKQFLVITENGTARMRPLLAQEAARLMGAPDNYRLPMRETPALKVIGEAVSAPAVRWLGAHLLSPLTHSAHMSKPAAVSG